MDEDVVEDTDEDSIDDLYELIENLETQVAERNAYIEKLHATIDARNSYIDRLHNKIDRLRAAGASSTDDAR